MACTHAFNKVFWNEGDVIDLTTRQRPTLGLIQVVSGEGDDKASGTACPSQTVGADTEI